MERQEKGGSTYLFLALVTLAFLAAVLYLTFGANRTEQEGYTCLLYTSPSPRDS